MMKFIHEAETLNINYILKPAEDELNFLKSGHNYLFFFDSTKEGEVVEAVKLNKFPPYRVRIQKDSKLIELANEVGSDKP